MFWRSDTWQPRLLLSRIPASVQKFIHWVIVIIMTDSEFIVIVFML